MDTLLDMQVAAIKRQLTEGVKYDQDKPDFSLLSSYAITELCKVLTFGGRKYDLHNWRKGIAITRLIAASLRHIFSFLAGESKDPETGLSHIAHAMCCCMFILELMEVKPECDDRFIVVVAPAGQEVNKPIVTKSESESEK